MNEDTNNTNVNVIPFPISEKNPHVLEKISANSNTKVKKNTMTEPRYSVLVLYYHKNTTNKAPDM